MAQYQRKVVWFEGMTLDPHHFQQWDRYQQSVLNARMRSLSRYDWGLTRIEIDKERLANGEFVLLGCSGVMPDGFLFDIPDGAPAPEPRNVQEHFGATDDRLPVFLAVPSERSDGGNILLQNAANRRETRFKAETATVPDENTGVDERSVEVARGNVQVRFGGEAMQAYTTLRIAEILRSTSGVYALDEQFVPPCLNVSASGALMAIARRLLELLVTKGSSLAERQQGASKQRELTPSDIRALGLLSAVNTYIPLMQHHHEAGESHPEELYTTMLAAAGQLSAYTSASKHPKDFPTYSHDDLTSCFTELDGLLREMLGEAEPASNYVQVGLDKKRENLYAADVDSGLLQRAQFYLLVRSDTIPEEKLISEVPLMLRVATPETIDAVLRSYTRALTIEHTTRLPVGMPVDQQANYFQLQKRGPFWESIQDETSIAIFVPTEFDDLNMKLVAIQQS